MTAITIKTLQGRDAWACHVVRARGRWFATWVLVSMCGQKFIDSPEGVLDHRFRHVPLHRVCKSCRRSLHPLVRKWGRDEMGLLAAIDKAEECGMGQVEADELRKWIETNRR